MSSRASALSILALAASLGACASTGVSVHVVSPTTKVALADFNDPVYRAIAIADVSGETSQFFLTELPWSDRRVPSHGAVKRMVTGWLYDADLLARDYAHAKYLLKIAVETPPPPPASAPKAVKEATPALKSVSWSLVDAQTGAVVLQKTYEVAPESAAADAAQTAPLAPPRAPGALITGSFNDFLLAMSDADMIRVRRAVPCDMVDPAGGLGPAVIRKTSEAVGFDCPI